MFVLGNTMHVIGNLEVEVVPFLSRGEGGTMVHSQCEGMIQDWEELRDDFCVSFSSSTHTASLRSEILAFE